MDAPAQSVNVLLVENDSSVANAAHKFLDLLGHTVQRANNGTHALSIVARKGIPDVILTGLHLTGSLDGADLIKRLRADSSSMIPAIIMTGDTSSLCRERVAGIASCSLHIKPFDGDVLASALEVLAITKILPFNHSE